MGLLHRLIQLQKMSPRHLPRIAARRLSASVVDARERLLYTPGGARREPPVRALRRLSLVHPDVLSASFGERFQQKYPSESRQIQERARQAKDLVFDLLGSGPVDLKAFRNRTDLRLYDGSTAQAAALARGGLVPWHFDFKSGVGWASEKFFSEIRWGARGVDIKVPWELSRCAHFVTLGQAYAITGDESYTRAFSDQLEDWIKRNPPKHGVNWVCAMDVALRACNWILAWDFFERSPLVSEFVRTHLAGALWEHGRHIRDHLEWHGDLSTNHYVADLVGLVYIGRAVGEDAWFDFALSELAHEIETQTHDDGFDFEAATAYHRLVFEIFFFSALAASEGCGDDPGARRQALNRQAGPAFVERLQRMTRALTSILDSTGRLPLIGDNDSGRVHTLLRRDDTDAAFLSELAALLLADGDLRGPVKGSSESVWFFGLGAAEALPPPSAPSMLLPPGKSGIAVLRGPNDVLVFAAQPTGTRGVGNHTHNDKLSFCLSVGADVFFADPGTLAYTAAPDERNVFRSTAAHSTVQVDGEEQNRIYPARLFSISDDADAAVTQYKDGVRVAAEHDGYTRLDDPVVHRRSIERFSEPLRWIVEDNLDGKLEHSLRWRFVCGAGVRVTEGDAGAVRLIGSEGEVELKAHPAQIRFQVEKGRLAPAYGVAVETSVISAMWTGVLPFRATFTLLWRAAAGRR